jgi:hypothetical protein
MKHFDSIKEKYSELFKAIALLINFLHMHHQYFTFEIISECEVSMRTWTIQQNMARKQLLVIGSAIH